MVGLEGTCEVGLVGTELMSAWWWCWCNRDSIDPFCFTTGTDSWPRQKEVLNENDVFVSVSVLWKGDI